MRLRYTPIRKIADGDTAEIFLATQHGAEGFEKRVILKRILPALYADKQFRKLLVDEAHIAAGLNHSSIVQVLDLGEQDGRYFLALELVDGWTLERVLRRTQAAGVPIPPALALYVTAEVCRALSYAHTQAGADGKPLGIVHGDVCPDNVLLSAQGEVKLTDFGMAKAHSRRTQVTGILKPANAAYMSPEQAGSRPVDARSDLFSAGSMLYTMITGRLAFGADDDARTLELLRSGQLTPSETLKPELGPEIHRLIERAMATAPEGRFARAEDMLVEVERVMRIALRPVGQTELMRWLSQLSEKDGVPPLTRDTGAPAAAPATPTPTPVSAPPVPPPAPVAAMPPPRIMAGGIALPPPPPGNVPGLAAVLPPPPGAAPAQVVDDSGTEELADGDLEAEPVPPPPPPSGAISAGPTVVMTTAPGAPAQEERFDIPRVAGVEKDRRNRIFWIAGAIAALAMIGIGARVMMSGSTPPKVAVSTAEPPAQPKPPEAPPVPAAPVAEAQPVAAPTPSQPDSAVVAKAEPAPKAEPEAKAEEKAPAEPEPKAEEKAPAEPAPKAEEKAPPAPAPKPEEKAPAPAAKSSPKPQPKDGKVALVVKTTPTGCYLTAAGKAIGHTPVSLKPTPGTTYHFTFTKAGYDTVEKSFTVSERAKQSMHVTMKKSAAKPAPAPAAPAPEPKKEKHWWQFGR